MIRFLSNATYFFNIDDDLILGENTLKVMDQRDAIPAAYGRFIDALTFDPPMSQQHGINPSKEMQSVDFLVVSYGLKLEYVKAFW